jgi:hypothetical protein
LSLSFLLKCFSWVGLVTNLLQVLYECKLSAAKWCKQQGRLQTRKVHSAQGSLWYCCLQFFLFSVFLFVIVVEYQTVRIIIYRAKYILLRYLHQHIYNCNFKQIWQSFNRDANLKLNTQMTKPFRFNSIKPFYIFSCHWHL